MCGIAGFIDISRKGAFLEATKTLELMMNAIIHRGPDDYGMSFYGYENYNDQQGKKTSIESKCDHQISLGHRRLSIIDLSENGRQPMQNRDHSLEIIFNGEIYNYLELKKQHFSDYPFKTETDTEVLLACYEKWGIDMLNKLDGMFSFALYDIKQNKMLFARDAMGIKPFYYAKIDSKFFFASEPKAIQAAIKSKLTLDINNSAEFLVMGLSDHTDGTFFKEIKQLNGGHLMMYDLVHHSIEIKKYWNAPQVQSNPSDHFPATYWEIAKEAVTRQLRSDVPLGTSLSGGIDSSVILVLASEILGEHSNQYNAITYIEKGFVGDESKDARSIAENAGLNWHGVEVDQTNLCDDVDRMITSIGEPFSSLSMYAQYKVMEYAKNIGIKVMLDGQGGDEIYLGYPRVAQFVLSEYLREGKIGLFYRELIGLKNHASLSFKNSILGNIYFSNSTIAVTRNISSLSNYINKDFLHQYRKETAEDLYSSKSLQERQIDELTKYCLPRLLRYADRNSMAFSVESRVPHLSNLIIDFALKAPIEWRIRDGWTKYYVRKAAENSKIPQRILYNPLKRGFEVPQNQWVKKLAPLINQYIENASPYQHILNLDHIQSKINSDLNDSEATKLWRSISFMAFLQKNNLNT